MTSFFILFFLFCFVLHVELQAPAGENTSYEQTSGLEGYEMSN